MSGIAAVWTPFLRLEYRSVTAASDAQRMFQGMLESGLKIRMGAAI